MTYHFAPAALSRRPRNPSSMIGKTVPMEWGGERIRLRIVDWSGQTFVALRECRS